MDAGLETSKVGKYQLIASLGRGGMADVYLALVAGPGGFNKLLVLKTIREDVVNNVEGGLAMFLDEARLTARLVHPNIVTTYEVGEHAGTYFLAMEYLEGQTYRALCNRGRPSKLPLAEELRILSETARGLHYVHELENYDGTPLHVVHRDVSPQNVFITYDGLVKLLDFGIAKSAEGGLTQVGVIKGKLDYIAPEQLRSDAIDRRADVFALGAMLWEAVTGKRFAGGRKLADVAKAQNRLAGGERRVRELRPELPSVLVEIVERAIALEPGQRFESAAAFADALDAFLSAESVKPGARSLSGVITPLFEVERLRMRKTIEEQILLSQQRGVAQGLLLPAVRASSGDSSTGLSVALAGTSLALAPPNRRSQRTATVVVLAAITAIAAATFVALTRQRSVVSPAASTVAVVPMSAAAPAAVPVAAAPVAAQPVVHLQLSVTPASASVTLDGAPISVPFAGEFRRDRTLHHLQVSAAGYRADHQLIAFEQDSTRSIVLERVPVLVRRVNSEPRPVPRPSALVATSTEAPAGEPLRPKGRPDAPPIDTEDPYANK